MTTGSEIIQRLNCRRTERRVQLARGNGACLVVVDSRGSYWQRCIVEETILVALEHFGMPYRILDLASERPTAETLGTCAVILLAQNGLGESLLEEESRAVADAVREGVGLVNFDCDLRLYHPALLELFGLDRAEFQVYATNQIRICDRSHYITGMQDPDECHRFEQMTSAVAVKSWGDGVEVLARGVLGKDQLVHSRHLIPGSTLVPGHWPALLAARRGRGRAVQFAINMRVWLASTYGHGRKMDDLFWRAIVWAARKPFAANMVPPLVCLSIDDCDGRTDFRYVEAACEHGFVPLPTMNIRNIPERLYAKIREMAASGKALVNTHAVDYYELLSFDFGKGECTRAELDGRFALHDAFWRKVGVRPSETVRCHWGEYGVRALPYFKQRGMLYFNPVLAMGLPKTDQPGVGGYWPYGLMNRMYECLPDDPDLFGFCSLATRGQEDFLTGCTVLLGECATNDVEKAARSAAGRILEGLRSGFFGELVTHEQKFDAIGVELFSRILARTGELTRDCEKIFANHDQIARYLKSKDSASIAEISASDGSVRARMAGRAPTALRLSVFRDEADGVVREYRAVDPFDGQTNVE